MEVSQMVTWLALAGMAVATAMAIRDQRRQSRLMAASRARLARKDP